MSRTASELQELSARHTWGHFSQLAPSNPSEIAVIDRGEGCYVWDASGKRYLDGLAGLYTVNAGHGRSSIANAMAQQAESLAYFPLWTYTHPVAIELAARLAKLAPGDLNRVFFTTGGSEAVESAWKLARQYHATRGEPKRYKAIARQTAYHGTTMGALSLTGVAEIRGLFEPLVPGGIHVENTNRYRCAFCASGPSCTLQCADDIERAILREGADTIAAVFLEPVQNSGGCFTPPPGYFERVREICDRHGVLLVNGEPQVLPPAATTSYLVRLAMGQRPDSLLALLGLPKSLVQPGRTAIELPLNKALAEIVERFHGVVSASPMRLASGAPRHIFPFSPRYPWNGDDFGPLVVPRKGGSIRIDVDDFPLYDRIMSTYEGHALSADRDRLMIDGRPLEAYVVERNYYFVLGDSRHFSADSRYWGFLPQDHIVGRGGAVVFHGGVR